MICIINAKVVLENGILFNGRILVDGDKIIAVGDAKELEIPNGAEVLDAQGAYVGPGFVDIHNHGGNGTMYHQDPIKTAEYFLSHGETTQLAALYYDLSKEDFLAAIDRVKSAIGGEGAGQALAGFYMEGPYLNPNYGASPSLNKWKGEIKAEDYQPLVDCAGDYAKVWAIAPEREGIEPFMAYVKEKNPDIVFSMAHCEGTYEQTARLKKYGLGMMTHCMNATGAISKCIGTKGFGPDEWCLYDNDMYAELICDSLAFHVNAPLQRLLIKIKGVEKMVLIVDSFVTDNVPAPELAHITDLSFDERGLLCGSRLTMDVVCRNIMTHTRCGIAEAFLMSATNPAKAARLYDVGSIEVGKKANFVFVDDIFNVKKVMLNGKIV